MIAYELVLAGDVATALMSLVDMTDDDDDDDDESRVTPAMLELVVVSVDTPTVDDALFDVVSLLSMLVDDAPVTMLIVVTSGDVSSFDIVDVVVIDDERVLIIIVDWHDHRIHHVAQYMLVDDIVAVDVIDAGMLNDELIDDDGVKVIDIERVVIIDEDDIAVQCRLITTHMHVGSDRSNAFYTNNIELATITTTRTTQLRNNSNRRNKSWEVLVSSV